MNVNYLKVVGYRQESANKFFDAVEGGPIDSLWKIHPVVNIAVEEKR